VLYVPYLIGSNWFWARLSELSKSFSQVAGFGQSFLNTDESVMSLNPLWQYSLSQVLAAAVVIMSTWMFARVARRPRKQR
jgi:ABC-type amino acid transport system permease subunit